MTDTKKLLEQHAASTPLNISPISEAWEVEEVVAGSIYRVFATMSDGAKWCVAHCGNKAQAEFIAAAHNAILALCAEIDGLRAEVERLKSQPVLVSGYACAPSDAVTIAVVVGPDGIMRPVPDIESNTVTARTEQEADHAGL